MGNDENLDRPNLTRLVTFAVIAVVILGAAIYSTYRYSQSRSGSIAIPAGQTYLGATPTVYVPPTPTKEAQPPTAPLRFTASSDVSWKTHAGLIYPYSFLYPTTLPLVIFPNDPSDSVAISWGNIPPQINLLLNIEFIDKRDTGMVGKPKIDYVKNWYKYFSGLKGVAKVEPFTNVSGLKGYKAYYINWTDSSPNVDVFFEIPNSDKMMLHLANGIIDPPIFNRILDSLRWIAPTPSRIPTDKSP